MAGLPVVPMFQSEANSLPGQMMQAGTVIAAGQNQGIPVPYQAEANVLPGMVPAYQNVPIGQNPVGAMIYGYNAEAGAQQPRMVGSQMLNFARPSGSLARQTTLSGLGGAVYQSRSLEPLMVGGLGRATWPVTGGVRGIFGDTVWYKSPVYWAGVGVVTWGVWYVMRKKK